MKTNRRGIKKMSLSDDNEAQKRIKRKIEQIEDKTIKMCEQVESLVNVVKDINNNLEELF